MIALIIRRLGVLLLTMLAMSFVVFVSLEINPDGVARKAIGQFTTVAQRMAWLAREQYYVFASGDEEKADYEKRDYVLLSLGDNNWLVFEKSEDLPVKTSVAELTNEEAEVMTPLRVPLLTRYGRWLSRFAVGDFGMSFRFKRPVAEVLWPRLANTGILAGLVMLLMVPLALFLGVMAGMREGSLQDRIFSVIAILTTSVPEFASAVFFVGVFTFALKWLPGTSSMLIGFSWAELVMPVGVLVIYGSGYIARITRASMAEVMGSPFIRTAILKGMPYRRVIMKHALRNALITPVTVIMLQFPWLLSGVIVVEYFFAYRGFGSLLWEAANNTDPYLIEACAMVSVVVVVITQLIADIIYTYINPRIRFQ